MLQACRPQGCCRGAMAPPDFGSSVNSMYLNQKGHMMPTTLLRAPPDFLTSLRSCVITLLSKALYLFYSTVYGKISRGIVILSGVA